MSIFSRFFGRKEDDADKFAQLVANPAIENPLSLEVLFAKEMRLDADALAKALRAYDRSMASARCEIDPEISSDGKLFGIAGWDKHVIQLIGFELPMPAEALEACVAPAHYSQALKAEARSHSGHVILYYAGYEPSPLEQYVALAAFAGVLSHFGAIIAVNEAGRTSLPAEALSGREVRGNTIELLRSFPLPILYCGFVKYCIEGSVGVWMRTYAADLLGLSDLATHAAGHHEGQRWFDVFDKILRYLLESNAELSAGHTMQTGEDEFLRFRAPKEDEYFLESKGKLLVAEVIGPNEINRVD
jgi:hypothetical protein